MSNRAARSAHNFLVEYSPTSSGLSVPPYPSISGARTRYPARTHGPIWCRQPYLTQIGRSFPCRCHRHSPYVRKSVNAEDSLCCPRRLIVRVIYRLFIDKVIRPSGGELFGAVVEARWVHGVHFYIGRREAQHTMGGRVRTTECY
jgi:hypothetical protein